MLQWRVFQQGSQNLSVYAALDAAIANKSTVPVGYIFNEAGSTTGPGIRTALGINLVTAAGGDPTPAVRQECSDVIIVAWLLMVHYTAQAAQSLNAGVIDLRIVSPINWEAIGKPVTKTGSALIVEEGPTTGGVATDITAGIAERGPLVNVTRLGSSGVPVRFSPVLENRCFPHHRVGKSKCMKSGYWMTMGASLGALALGVPHARASPKPMTVCGQEMLVNFDVDQGHAWRPPFGLDRIGAPIRARIRIEARETPSGVLRAVIRRSGDDTMRHRVELTASAAPVDTQRRRAFLADVPLKNVPDAADLEIRCPGTSAWQSIAHQSISWPEIEADAVAVPRRVINPVDLGAVLPPHGWVISEPGGTVDISFRAVSRRYSLHKGTVRAWFEGGRPTTIPLNAAKGHTTSKALSIAAPQEEDRTTLHVALFLDGEVKWRKSIPAMIVRPINLPRFGAVATKLRYDSPIPVYRHDDGKPGTPVDAATAWNSELDDIIVALPTGERFVFWRGASYAPFWANRSNFGLSYQWAETIRPPGNEYKDALEPLQDKELRFSRVSIIEASASRIHVRWTYQSVDANYRSNGDTAREDYYFYPDGFGVRNVIIQAAQPQNYAYSEFITVLPQGGYPLQLLTPRLDLLFLDGTSRRFDFPILPSAMSPLEVTSNITNAQNPPLQAEIALGLNVKALRAKGDFQGADVLENMLASMIGRIDYGKCNPAIYRIALARDDPAPAIYFAPGPARKAQVFAPFFDHGERVTWGYWGNHWPLVRGLPTGRDISTRIMTGPSHEATIGVNEPPPLIQGEAMLVDASGRPRLMHVEHRAWLIGKANVSDAALRDWAESFSTPPKLSVEGGRLDVPAYEPQRRAMRIVAEANEVSLRFEPHRVSINPVVEIDRAPGPLRALRIDGRSLPASDYAWDGRTLWLRTTIGAAGATVRLSFDDVQSDQSRK